MTWKPDEIEWLNLRPQDHEDAITMLLSSNPVLMLNGTVVRFKAGKEHRKRRHKVRCGARQEAHKTLNSELKNYEQGVYPPSYTSQKIQEKMVGRVTQFLIIQHYISVLDDRDPQPTDCSIEEGQVWYPASHYVINGDEIFDWNKKTPLTGEKDRRSEREFYSSELLSGRRPAVVLKIRQRGEIFMVPFSSNPVGRNRVFIATLNGYAVCDFEFRVHWKMLCKDEKAYDDQRLKQSELRDIKQKVANLNRYQVRW